MKTQKRSATDFLQLVIAGRIEEAFRKYVNMSGKHHNPYFPAVFPALQKAMMENHEQFPHKTLAVKNVIDGGDVVAVHSHLVMSSGEKGLITVHTFRFEGEKIVEMWDCGQPLQANSPNEDGAF